MVNNSTIKEKLNTPIGTYIEKYKKASEAAYNDGDFILSVSFANKAATLLNMVAGQVFEIELDDESDEEGS